MFTGIISNLGEVLEVKKNENSLQFSLRARFADGSSDPVQLGESIAVNGVCLTVAEQAAETYFFFVSAETLEMTNFKTLRTGDTVNLERALKLSDRLSGHLVQGHVDGTAKLLRISHSADGNLIDVELPSNLVKYCVPKGSITLDGISLTVNSIQNDRISLMIIPHTWAHTNLKARHVGDSLNVEVDMIAKLILREREKY